MNIEITRINQGIETDYKDFIRSVNEEYLYKLKKIADDIAYAFTKDNGFYKYTKVLSKEEFDGLTKLTEAKIKEAVERIFSSDFEINPKMFESDTDVKGCRYCQYQDICFRKNEDIKELHKYDDLSFLKEGDDNA